MRLTGSALVAGTVGAMRGNTKVDIDTEWEEFYELWLPVNYPNGSKDDNSTMV